MMYQKAMLFGDEEVAQEILDAEHPRLVKSLGRKVRDFDDKKWGAHREIIVRDGNILKFTNAVTEEGFRKGTSSNAESCEPIEGSLKAMLLATGNSEIVEASPRDRIWGVGYGPKNAPNNRDKWGKNLLGKALMEVREILRKAEEEDEEKKEDKDKEDKDTAEDTTA